MMIALAGCSRVVPDAAPPPVATPSPRPNPAPAAPPPAAEAWDRIPATPGSWQHRMAGRDSVADFVSPDGALLFQMTCSADRDIELAAVGRAPDVRALTIRTRSVERAVTASAMERSVIARLNPRDPLLASMAYARGTFAVEVPGLPALYLPAWPEVTRVVDDCQ